MRMRMSPTRRIDVRSERGSIIILSAVMIVVLMGFVGLALDSGSLFTHRRQLQTAADGGALQGGHELQRGNTSLVNSAALTGTAENGYANGTDGVTVEVYNPPVTGYYVGDNAAVEVVVRQPSPITFMQLFGFTSPTIPARAVAWAGANSKNCILILEETEQDAFDYQSSAVLNAPTCALVDNSSDPWAGRLTSDADVTVATATFTGGYIEESNSSMTMASGYGPYTDVWPRATDPLAWLPAPSGGAPYGCDFIDMEYDAPDVYPAPGVYCGKFTLKNATHAHLDPGMYIMQGGPMKIEGDSILEGTGVTFYFTEGNGYDFEPFSFSSNAQAILSAPDTCTPGGGLANGCSPGEEYFGILFWADPNAGDPDDEFRFESNSTHQLSGSIYFPDHIFNVESSTVINSDYLIVVVRRYIAESNSVVNIGTNFPAGGSVLKRLALVE